MNEIELLRCSEGLTTLNPSFGNDKLKCYFCFSSNGTLVTYVWFWGLDGIEMVLILTILFPGRNYMLLTMYYYVHCLIIFTLSPKYFWIWSCCFCFSYGGGFRLRSCFGCIGWNKNIYINSILYTRWLKYQHLIPVFRLLNNLCEFTTRIHNLYRKTSFKGWVS